MRLVNFCAAFVSDANCCYHSNVRRSFSDKIEKIDKNKKKRRKIHKKYFQMKTGSLKIMKTNALH